MRSGYLAISRRNGHMHGELSGILGDVTVNLCSNLSQVLPSLCKNWWIDCVYANLPPEHQIWIKNNKISSLTGLDLSRLLQVFLKNWHAISRHRVLSPDLRNYANEMKTIRNRWAHSTAELPDKLIIERDLSTIHLFCLGISADRTLIEKIEGAMAKLRGEKAPAPMTPPPRGTAPISPPKNRGDQLRTSPEPSPLANRHLGGRKPWDPQLVDLLKKAVGASLRAELHEDFRIIGRSQLAFPRSGRRYLCKFSSFDHKHSRWFWGVSRTYWAAWTPKDHLILILENWKSQGYSYILFDAQTSKQLLERCGQDKREEKKINMTISATEGRIRLQEWSDLLLENRIKPLEGVEL